MIARFEDIVGVPIDFHQDGYLFLLSKSANVETFKKNVALQQKHGVDVRWVSNEEARELAPGSISPASKAPPIARPTAWPIRMA